MVEKGVLLLIIYRGSGECQTLLKSILEVFMLLPVFALSERLDKPVYQRDRECREQRREFKHCR